MMKMKYPKLLPIIIMFLCIFLIFSNLFFFRPPILDFLFVPRIVWEILVSVIFGIIIGFLISKFIFTNKIYLISTRKIFQILFAFSVFLAFMVTFQGGLKFTQNRLSAVPLRVVAFPADNQSVYINNIIYNEEPLDLQNQCRLKGNFRWGEQGNLVLDSTLPQGEVLCILYPGVFGYAEGNKVEINFKRHLQGGEAIIYFGQREYQIHTKIENDGMFDEYISLKTPLTMGILLGLIVEFFDFFLVSLIISLLITSSYSKKDTIEKIPRIYHWNGIFCITFFYTLVYEIMEWLFIVTKPSFLNTISILNRIKILIFACSIMAGIYFLILFIVFAISVLPFWGKRKSVYLSLAKFLPALILSSLALLLLDNFTYTLFNFGIVTTEGYFRSIYALLFVNLFIYISMKTADLLSLISKKIEDSRMKSYFIPLIVLLIVASIMSTNDWQKNIYFGFVNSTEQMITDDLPNIILITGDGIDANHTSLYGYERNTTPRINELAKESLVAENAFSNAGMTYGSVASIYTGKYPTTTRVLLSPDILKGEDAYQHFPGILNSMGYFLAQYSPPNVDAYAYNLLSGFDDANGRSVQSNEDNLYLNKYFQTENTYFILETSNRIMDRLKHIFLFEKMNNPQDLIRGKRNLENDQVKIDKVVDILNQNKFPFFVHLHWMGTHGPSFNPKIQIFSKGKSIENQKDSDIDFYDDSILEFDSGVGQIIDALISKGLFDKTILIIGSDHGQIFRTLNRIPLMIRFPNSKHSGRIKSNVQNIDIAPTILDYLGLDQPTWMEGISLLNGVPGLRPIFGFTRIDGDQIEENPKPPFFQFGSISCIYCNTYFRLDLNPLNWRIEQIVGHTTPCADDIISKREVLMGMINHLKEKNFDTLSLNNISIEE